MIRKRFKKILSVLLSVGLGVSMLPGSAFAAEKAGTPKDVIPSGYTWSTDSEGINPDAGKENRKYIYFGKNNTFNLKWQVLENTGNGSLQLLADSHLINTRSFDDGNTQYVQFNARNDSGNAWKDSEMRNWMNDTSEYGFLKDDNFSAAEVNAMAQVNVDGQSLDKMYIPSVDEVKKGEWGFYADGSLKDGNRRTDAYWRLRTPGADGNNASVAYVDYRGIVMENGSSVGMNYGVRPIFQIDLSQVVMMTPASGGKSSGLGVLSEVEIPNGELKLTLIDDQLNFTADEKDIYANAGEEIKIPFSQAATGNGFYVSCLIQDQDGSLRYYGKLSQAESGEVSITLPEDIEDGAYTLKLFNEQINGNNLSDYASDPAVIELSVGEEEVSALEALTVLYNQLSSLDSSLFTEDSYQVLEEALIQAGNVINSGTPGFKEIADAYLGLTSARDQLVFKTVKDLLQAAIQAAQKADTSNASPEAIEALNEAIKNGKTVLADQAATQQQIDKAVEDILAAMDNLGDAEAGDHTYLNDYIDIAKKLNEDNYTKESWEKMQEALAAAEIISAKTNASQDEIDQAADALYEALMGLEPAAYRNELEFIISCAYAVLNNADNFVPDSIQGLQEATEQAEQLLKNPEASSEEMKKAAADLASLVAQARLKANKTTLNQAVAYANTFLLDAFTEESVEVLNSALAAAVLAINDENIDDQEFIDQLELAIREAIDNLIKKSIDDKKDDKTDETGDTEESDETKETSSAAKTNGKNGKNKSSIKTGDIANVGLWMGIILLAAAAITIIVGLKRKKGSHKITGLLLVLAMVGGTLLVPGIAQASMEQELPGKGLWADVYEYTQGTNRVNVDRFTFEEENYVGGSLVGNLDGSVISLLNRHKLATKTDYFSVRFYGTITPLYSEEYTFYMTGDDGFRMWLDGELVIDFWQQVWDIPQMSVPIPMTAGQESEIVVEYNQGWGGAALYLSWESRNQEKEIVPETALAPPAEHVVVPKATELEVEIEKAKEKCDDYEDTMPAIVAPIKAAIEEGENLLAEIGEMEKTDAEKVNLLVAAINKLNELCINLFKELDVMDSEEHKQFNNPLYQGQDPHVAYHDGFYYFVSSSNLDSNNKIYVSKSRTLTDQGEKIMVFNGEGTHSGRIFAPEIFFIDGHWYIYYCADFGGRGHLATVIKSETDDAQGKYTHEGPLYCGENGTIYQANDITVFEYNDQLYAVWGTLGTGQPKGPAIARMDDPITITEDRFIVDESIGGGEGPRVLQKDGKIFITMSHDDYMRDSYHLQYFYNEDGDLLNWDSWTAVKDKVLKSANGVSGPARAVFTESVDGTEDWMLYHSRVFNVPGRNWWRQVNLNQIKWDDDGMPIFSDPVSPTTFLDLPSGDPGMGDMYQAEDAILYGGSTIGNEYKNSIGTYVNIPDEIGAEVSFVIEAEEAADFILGTRYTKGDAAENEAGNHGDGAGEVNLTQLPTRGRVNIYVNGKFAKVMKADKTRTTWEEYFTASERVALEAGKNVITYKVDSGCLGNVNIDYITLYQADVPNKPREEVKVESISLENTIVGIGQSTDLNAQIIPANYTSKIVWKSSDPSKAVVNTAGIVTGKSYGKVIITATVDGVEASCEVEMDYNIAESITLDKESGSLTVPSNTEMQLNAAVLPNDADGKVVWESSNPYVADVDQNGKVTARYDGVATITAKIDEVQAQCVVTVSLDSSIETISAYKATFDSKDDDGGFTIDARNGLPSYAGVTNEKDATGNGGYCILIDKGGSFDGEALSWATRSFKLEEDNDYNLKLKYRNGDGGNVGNFRIRITSGQGEDILKDWTVVNAGEWVDFEADISKYAGQYFTLYLEQQTAGNGTGVGIFLDDIYINQK